MVEASFASVGAVWALCQAWFHPASQISNGDSSDESLEGTHCPSQHRQGPLLSHRAAGHPRERLELLVGVVGDNIVNPNPYLRESAWGGYTHTVLICHQKGRKEGIVAARNTGREERRGKGWKERRKEERGKGGNFILFLAVYFILEYSRLTILCQFRYTEK